MPKPGPRPMRQIRREKDIPQRYLAQALGVAVQTVSEWERGRRSPSIATARRIAAILGVALDDILFPAELKASAGRRRRNGPKDGAAA